MTKLLPAGRKKEKYKNPSLNIASPNHHKRVSLRPQRMVHEGLSHVTESGYTLEQPA